METETEGGAFIAVGHTRMYCGRTWWNTNGYGLGSAGSAVAAASASASPSPSAVAVTVAVVEIVKEGGIGDW